MSGDKRAPRGLTTPTRRRLKVVNPLGFGVHGCWLLGWDNGLWKGLKIDQVVENEEGREISTETKSEAVVGVRVGYGNDSCENGISVLRVKKIPASRSRFGIELKSQTKSLAG